MPSPLPPELVALNYGCEANHDIPLATVARPSKVDWPWKLNLTGNWLTFASVVHNDILIYLEKLMYIAFSSFLGLVLCFFWIVTAATAAYVKGEGWKPGGNETALINTYPIQESIIVGNWI
ncbi:hypothetical protein SLEP1_g4954 [Rubroshorea leprosula]|uniref:Uncharacterized protein n=1 Tax=Rubroshorea leprosula TaxID=152421 RepID=A0AAV5HWB2_9ROSI|nr:hypothetical protein SLEP1_g4954 [Rubroshorea leprosula]